MRSIVKRVNGMQGWMSVAGRESGIMLVVMPAGHPDLEREVDVRQGAVLLPRSGLIVLPSDGQIASGQSR